LRHEVFFLVGVLEFELGRSWNDPKIDQQIYRLLHSYLLNT
jgi:hypothetical protein